MKMIAGRRWTLKNLKNTYGEKLGQKIHDSKNIKVACLNSKCNQFNKAQEIPGGIDEQTAVDFEGEVSFESVAGLISCPDCNTSYFGEAPKPKDPEIRSNFDEVSKPKSPEARSKDKDKALSQPSSGTAFFIDNKGHVVTNYHVVKSCNDNSKIIYDNEEVNVKLIASDEQLDLALLKANIKNKNCIEIKNKVIKKMQHIIAAGYPFGKELSDDLKFTSGIVSSLKGMKNDSTRIQIDAALNYGNSGGPIVDKKTGELVAVAVAGLRKDMTESINYGIKASQVKDFLESNRITLKSNSDKSKKKDVSDILEDATVYIFCN